MQECLLVFVGHVGEEAQEEEEEQEQHHEEEEECVVPYGFR